ncbi:hypothetical protein BBP40_000611 [Aspergillus hancockii]|nr:hypothetical protein BBP40_000611 [Aspergillus hancockii]
MSREIDRLAQPASKKKMRVIVASCSRTGTLGLHTALGILGYTPYHMVEVLFKGGLPYMKVFQEAIVAQHNRFSGIKRYESVELDKWMGDYDCLIEIPSYIGLRSIEAYAQDPEVKFILTERNPDKWVKSFNNTLGEAIRQTTLFPMNILKHFDPVIGNFFHLTKLMYWSFSDGTTMGDPNNEDALRRNYVEYIRTVKEMVPKDRLLVVRLEDGLGWEQVCPFLDLPIPGEKYPRGNDPDKFHLIVEELLGPRAKLALLRLSALVLPVMGLTGYLGWRHFRN